MRKLYALLAGLFLCLAGTQTMAQTSTPDVANFSYTIDATGFNVSFANTSVLGSEPGPRHAYWSFGDGSTQTTGALDGTQHHYANAGTYTVCLRLFRYGTNSTNPIVTAEYCATIIIHPPRPDSCTANFERIEVSTTNSPLRVYLKALPWHNNNKRPVMICWQFGDGTDTCIQYSNTNPGPYTVGHTYASPGVYEVCVKIIYQGGCEARKCKEIQVARPDSCSADFVRLPVTASNSVLRAYFKALPWHNNHKKPAKICWSFGDGRDTCINYLNLYNGDYVVGHTYREPGNYEVCVKISYFGGCEARKCKPVQVGREDSCRADFERLPISSTNDQRVAYFKALPWHNNNKKPATICWKFGDGRDTCINYPQNYTGNYVVGHRYEHSGNYEVCVKISYYGGCEARKCKPVVIQTPDECSADFERIPVSTVNDQLRTYFKALPWNSNNRKPARICWTFGDGTDTCINYGPDYNGNYVVPHNYQHPGTYEVCVKILYYGGCEARKCKTIAVPPIPTVCSVQLFEIAPSITSLVRGFIAVPQSTPPRRPERVCWSFGDGEDTCIMIDPTAPLPDLVIRHTYPGPGTYSACVKIRYQGGCEAYDCVEVVIRSSTNTCGGYMVETLVAPRTFKFKGFSINNPNDQVIGYRWSFGDGTGATGQEVSHTYAQGGDYEVCLNIRTHLGCETRICKTIRVPGNNTPSLHLSPNPVIGTMHVQFFSSHTETVNIKILNSNGVPVRIFLKNVNVGVNNWDHDLSNLLPGVYSYVLQSPNQLASAIFIKQ